MEKEFDCPPVLLLIFRRPDLTRRVIDALSVVKPSRLYIAADGPRDRPGERQLCDETRKVATQVQWPCQLKILFRNENLGCRVGVSTAIDWFFDQEDAGIILEDDCLPSPSFFPYCAELLARFHDDERIIAISGNNFQKGRDVTPYSYYFSKYMHCWGWASWRRAWALYDRDMVHWPEFRANSGLQAWSDGRASFESHWTSNFDEAAAGTLDSWASRFLFSCWAQNGLTCLPEKNLVSNIGFGAESTHTANPDDWVANIRAEELAFPLRHPSTVVRNIQADRFTDENVFWIHPAPSTSQRIKRKIVHVAKRIWKSRARSVGTLSSLVGKETNLASPGSSLSKEWDFAAAPLGNIPIAGERVRYAAAIKPLLKLSTDAFILEAGCGSGRILRSLSALGYKNIVGLEISQDRLRDISLREPKFSMLVNSSRVPFAAETFDAVVSAAVIEHVTDPGDWLCDLARVTRSGGIVSIATDTYVWRWLKRLGLYRSIQPLDEAIWPGNIIHWGRRAGLELTACGGFINTPDQRYYFGKQLLSLVPKTWRLRNWLNRVSADAIPSDETKAVLESIGRFAENPGLKKWDCVWSYECFYWFRKL